MSYNKNSEICDYIQLNFSDATVNNNVMSWNIPDVYYTNRRSPVCTVKMVEVAMLTSQNTTLLVKYKNSAQNVYSSKNSGAILASAFRKFDGGANTNYVMNNTNDIEVLTSARPQTISLEIVQPTDESVLISNSAYFVLRFKYYDPDEVAKNFISTSYKSML